MILYEIILYDILYINLNIYLMHVEYVEHHLLVYFYIER